MPSGTALVDNKMALVAPRIEPDVSYDGETYLPGHHLKPSGTVLIDNKMVLVSPPHRT